MLKLQALKASAGSTVQTRGSTGGRRERAPPYLEGVEGVGHVGERAPLLVLLAHLQVVAQLAVGSNV